MSHWQVCLPGTLFSPPTIKFYNLEEGLCESCKLQISWIHEVFFFYFLGLVHFICTFASWVLKSSLQSGSSQFRKKNGYTMYYPQRHSVLWKQYPSIYWVLPWEVQRKDGLWLIDSGQRFFSKTHKHAITSSYFGNKQFSADASPLFYIASLATWIKNELYRGSYQVSEESLLTIFQQ